MINSIKVMHNKPYKLLKSIGNNSPCTIKHLIKVSKAYAGYFTIYKKIQQFVKVGLVNKSLLKKHYGTYEYSITPKGLKLLELLNKINNINFFVK